MQFTTNQGHQPALAVVRKLLARQRIASLKKSCDHSWEACNGISLHIEAIVLGCFIIYFVRQVGIRDSRLSYRK